MLSSFSTPLGQFLTQHTSGFVLPLATLSHSNERRKDFLLWQAEMLGSKLGFAWLVGKAVDQFTPQTKQAQHSPVGALAKSLSLYAGVLSASWVLKPLGRAFKLLIGQDSLLDSKNRKHFYHFVSYKPEEWWTPKKKRQDYIKKSTVEQAKRLGLFAAGIAGLNLLVQRLKAPVDSPLLKRLTLPEGKLRNFGVKHALATMLLPNDLEAAKHRLHFQLAGGGFKRSNWKWLARGLKETIAELMGTTLGYLGGEQLGKQLSKLPVIKPKWKSLAKGYFSGALIAVVPFIYYKLISEPQWKQTKQDLKRFFDEQREKTVTPDLSQMDKGPLLLSKKS